MSVCNIQSFAPLVALARQTSVIYHTFLYPGRCHLTGTGFALCGSALATVVFAASAQLLTAAMTRCVLKRRLLLEQQIAVRCHLVLIHCVRVHNNICSRSVLQVIASPLFTRDKQPPTLCLSNTKFD